VEKSLGAWVMVDKKGNVTGIQIVAEPEDVEAVQKAIAPLLDTYNLPPEPEVVKGVDGL